MFSDLLWLVFDLLFGTGSLVVEEDEAGWNCLTMGNGRCGQ